MDGKCTKLMGKLVPNTRSPAIHFYGSFILQILINAWEVEFIAQYIS